MNSLLSKEMTMTIEIQDSTMLEKQAAARSQTVTGKTERNF